MVQTASWHVVEVTSGSNSNYFIRAQRRDLILGLSKDEVPALRSFASS